MKTSTLSAALEDMTSAMYREFSAWEVALPVNASGQTRYPAPDVGLPDGWQALSCHCDYQLDTDLWLARRDLGGWAIVRHERDIDRSRWFWIDESLGALYGHVIDETNARGSNQEALPGITSWLKGVIVSMFDDNDPAEVAERTIFVLGGPLCVVPRMAR